MKYPYLLLDADNTLFDFDAGPGMHSTRYAPGMTSLTRMRAFCAMSGATMPCGQPLTEASVQRTFWL